MSFGAVDCRLMSMAAFDAPGGSMSIARRLIFSAVLLSGLTARTLGARSQYRVHPISSLPDGGVGLFDMNDRGQFVGFASGSAFVWTPPRRTDSTEQRAICPCWTSPRSATSRQGST